MEDVSKKILLVGGHMTPAFAVLDELDELLELLELLKVQIVSLGMLGALSIEQRTAINS